MIDYIYLRVTDRCNLHCKHCTLSEHRGNSFVDINSVTQFLHKLIGNGTGCSIAFHGGEPTLCPLNVLENFCCEFPYATFIMASNMIWSSPTEVISFVKKYCIDKETHVPCIKASYDFGNIRFQSTKERQTCLSNIKLCTDNNIAVQLGVPVTNELVSIPVQDIVRFLNSFHIDSLRLDMLRPQQIIDQTIVPSYSQVDKWLCQLYKYKNQIHVLLFEELIDAALYGHHESCRTRQCMSTTLTINVDGTFGGCVNNAHVCPYGSVETGTTDYELLQRLILEEQIRNEKCYLCDLFHMCNGWCYQIPWINNTCPAPKQLMRHIKEEYRKWNV